jgi:hypothetical protein
VLTAGKNAVYAAMRLSVGQSINATTLKVKMHQHPYT